MNSKTQSLHEAYCNSTGLFIRYDLNREYQWGAWMSRGFTEQDLVDVVKHLKAGIKNNTRQPGSLKFSNLIQDVERFEEDLALVRALNRRPKVDTNRQSALNATGRNLQPETKNTARSAADILKGEEAFKALKLMKEKL